MALLLLFFVVSGWVGLFLTLVVLGLFEAGVSYVGTRQWPDVAADCDLSRGRLRPGGQVDDEGGSARVASAIVARISPARVK